MAFKIAKSKGIIKVITTFDDAVAETTTKEDWDSYHKGLDETFLTFIEGKQPTRFIFNTELSMKARKEITSEQMKVVDGEQGIQLGFIFDDIRCSLIDIENPADIPAADHIEFKKDKDGFASKNLIASFPDKLIFDLYAAKQAQILDTDNQKK